MADALLWPAGQRRKPDSRPLLLIVDDDRMVGRTIGHAAESCGYRAVRTTSLEGFLQAFEASRPDVVAVDLRVPGHDGVEIIRVLADRDFGGLVLIISGLDRRIVDAALRLGRALGLSMAEPLAKPFRLDDLAERLGTEEQLVST